MLISEIQLLIKQYSSQVILDTTSIHIMRTNLLLSLYDDTFNLYVPVSVTLARSVVLLWFRRN